jgi:hypothetical protein
MMFWPRHGFHFAQRICARQVHDLPMSKKKNQTRSAISGEANTKPFTSFEIESTIPAMK